MRYVVFDKGHCDWDMIYCNCHEDREETEEEIVKALVSFVYVGTFSACENVCMNSGTIHNDSKVFILADLSVQYLWQIGSRVSDIEGAIIPHTYYVRKIGMIV